MTQDKLSIEEIKQTYIPAEFQSELDMILIRKYVSPCLNSLSSIKDRILKNRYLKREILDNDTFTKAESLIMKISTFEDFLFALRTSIHIKYLSKYVKKIVRILKMILPMLKLPLVNRLAFVHLDKYLDLKSVKLAEYLDNYYSREEQIDLLEKGDNEMMAFFDMFEKFYLKTENENI